MTNQPLSKRTLEEADPNSEIQPTSSKYLKKTNDGKESEEATEWYASLTHDDLVKLCKARGTRTVGGNRLQLIEQLKSLDRLGNPSQEEREEKLAAKLDDHFSPAGAFMKKRNQQMKEAEEQLKSEGKSKQYIFHHALDRVIANEHVESIENGAPILGNDMTKTQLVEICKVLGLETEGTKDFLHFLVCSKDDEIRSKSEKYKANQLNFALTTSPAGKQALEILIRDGTNEVCEERKIGADDSKTRLLVSLEVKEGVEKEAEKRVAEIAKTLEEDGFGVWEGDQIGAYLFNEVKLETGTGGYTAFRMVELKEMLRLRGLDVEGSKKELIKKLSDRDAENLDVSDKSSRSHGR